MDAVTIAALIGTALGTAIVTILAKLGYDRSQTVRRLKAADGGGEPDELMAPKREAEKRTDAAVAEAERLVRIEGKIDRLGDRMEFGFRRVDERQAEHEADDDRRHTAVLAELTRAADRLHEHDNWHTAHAGHIAEVRGALEMDTQVGPAPSPRGVRTAPRPAVSTPPRRTR